MATTRFYLDLRGRARDGKGSIVITIYHNRTTAMIPTGIRVSPDDWDGSRITRLSGSEALNSKISEQKSKIDKSIAILSMQKGFGNYTATEIKRRIEGEKDNAVPVLVSDLFYEYMRTDISQGTKDVYEATLKKIMMFDMATLKIQDIDLRWLHRFNKYLSLTQSVNSRSVYLRALRAICNYAVNIGATDSYPFAKFQIKQEPTKKKAISIEDFRRFLSYPTTQKNEKYRDFFLLMFYLIGINSKDLFLAKKTSLVDDRLEYYRYKTHKKYSIKIEPEAQVLLEKYQGKDYLLNVKERYKDYEGFTHKMNDALKQIGPVVEEYIPPETLFEQFTVVRKIQPIIPGISTYYARHSWATIAYEIGIPLDVISQALGHSSGNRTTLIYVKYDQSKVDDANRKVIDCLHHKPL